MSSYPPRDGFMKYCTSMLSYRGSSAQKRCLIHGAASLISASTGALFGRKQPHRPYVRPSEHSSGQAGCVRMRKAPLPFFPNPAHQKRTHKEPRAASLHLLEDAAGCSAVLLAPFACGVVWCGSRRIGRIKRERRINLRYGATAEPKVNIKFIARPSSDLLGAEQKIRDRDCLPCYPSSSIHFIWQPLLMW